MVNLHICIAVDVIIFTVIDERAHVLLIKRKNNPFPSMYAFPGGFIKDHETLKEAALRELEEETNLKYMEELEILSVYDAIDRDPRGRVISIAFIGAVNFENVNHIRASDEILIAEWVPISEVKELAFDHNKIFSDALNFLSSF